MKAYQGQGAYGAVYLAERVGWRRSQPGALKVSLLLWNARVEREVKLLSRLSHPSIPRLLDRGGSLPPSSAEYPYFVMEWVQGPELYAWAEKHTPSEKQVRRVLAQVARALEAVHAEGAVHRDVKGSNVLVRLLDRRAVLIDFGSCHFQGAQRLTWQALPPVTPEYLSPQAWRVYIRSQHHEEEYYEPSPADDLYALGVTAYRLVMGQYPEHIQAKQDEHGRWQARSPNPRPQLESNPRVDPLLREVIVRLLSDEPEARGTAAQVAETLEAGAGEEEGIESARPPVQTRAWKPWLTVAAVGVCSVWLWCSQWVPRLPGFSNAQAPDAGSAAVGDTSPTEPTEPEVATPSSEENKPIAQEPVPEPRPEQARPDKKGRCPGRKQVPMNGGCWEQIPRSVEECAESGYVHFKGECYFPSPTPPKRPMPTSSPEQER